jgi:hypothetical protein
MPELRLTVPLGGTARSYPAWLEWPAHVVPYRWRWFHRRWASYARFFWQPCPLCNQPFGGHEWRDIGGKSSQIPDPTQQPTSELGPFFSIGICPACTKAERGV